MSQGVCFQACICAYFFLLLLVDPWMTPHPDLPCCLPWACCYQHPGPSGTVELSLAPVLFPYETVLLLALLLPLLLPDIQVPALPEEEGSFS